MRGLDSNKVNVLGGVSGSQMLDGTLTHVIHCDSMFLHFSEVAKHMRSLLCLHPGSDQFSLY